MREPVEWPTRDLLHYRATTTPDRTAVVDVATNREWTYRAFDAVVDGVAARLSSMLDDEETIGTESSDGDVTGDPATRRRVGLLAATRVAFVAVVHASHRLGHTVVPLDTNLTSGELAPRIDRADVDVLVCKAATEVTALTVADCRVVSVDAPNDDAVDALQPAGRDGNDAIEPARWERGDTAIVMFTSGTTGDPKGVRLTLGNLVASATGSAFRLGVSPEDRWLDCLPAYHMGGLAPMLRCPLYGTALLVQQSFDVDATADALATYGVTGVSLVPTQLKRLLDSGWEPPESLSTVLVGGAPASRELLERALERDVPVYPTYGATETASQVATATPSDVARFPGTVGQPLVVTDVTVVDESGSPVETGETGELVVEGPTVSPGYLDDERMTAAVGEHGLHTGDVGYSDENGRVWVLGRVDDTIITGGENVHPTAVEDVLREHSEVTEVAVVGLPDEEWGQRVGALVVADGDVDDLESFTRERLADYKVPKVVGVVQSLPRTASGTVDRDAVRDRLSEL